MTSAHKHLWIMLLLLSRTRNNPNVLQQGMDLKKQNQKQNPVIHPYNGIPLSYLGSLTRFTQHHGGRAKVSHWVQEASIEQDSLYNSMYMTFWKRQKMQEQTADHCLPGVRGWEKFESRGCMGEFFGVLELFYILVLVVVMKIRACAKS